jgi:hypothetical protein
MGTAGCCNNLPPLPEREARACYGRLAPPLGEVRVRLDPATGRDPAILLDMNNAAIPDVNALDPASASWLVTYAVHSR